MDERSARRSGADGPRPKKPPTTPIRDNAAPTSEEQDRKRFGRNYDEQLGTGSSGPSPRHRELEPAPDEEDDRRRFGKHYDEGLGIEDTAPPKPGKQK